MLSSWSTGQCDLPVLTTVLGYTYEELICWTPAFVGDWKPEGLWFFCCVSNSVGCAGSLLLRRLFSGCRGQGLLPSAVLRLSLRRLLLLGSAGYRVLRSRSCWSSARLHRQSSGGARAELPCGMWDLPGPSLCLLHWQAYSLALSQQGGPGLLFSKRIEHFCC